jgi:hypothetical protein
LSVQPGNTNTKKKGYSTGFIASQRNVCAKFFKVVTGRSFMKEKTIMSKFEELIESVLNDISEKF